MLEKKEGTNTTVNIYGGNNQIQPNVTEANMIFYGDQFVPQELQRPSSPAATSVAPAPDAAPQPVREQSEQDARRTMAVNNLKLHITDEKKLEDYLDQLRICNTATRLAKTIVAMHREVGWPDDIEIHKEQFINDMKVLAPLVTRGDSVSNIRARIKAEE